ncbi:MAG TPA: hypothetical protein VF466_04300 [Candidatus Saccharimonadales bacterium]
MGIERGAGATPQEELIIALNGGLYDSVLPVAAQNLRGGQSPSYLSVARPDALFGFAEAWQQADPVGKDADPQDYKTNLFDEQLPPALRGDPAAISELPKLATSVGRLSLALQLVLDNRGAVQEWRTGRQYLQYAGSFDPQHVGHRLAVASGLDAAGAQSSALVQTMGGHPVKADFSRPYDERYAQSEARFYMSPFIDNARVTQVDVPAGTGLARTGLEQMRLLAEFCGDDRLRWLIGSDKFLADTAGIRQGKPQPKAAARFADPRLHAYVLHRQSDPLSALENAIDYIAGKFGTAVTLVRERPYDCAPASSTSIKLLRAQGRQAEADHMELYELAR